MSTNTFNRDGCSCVRMLIVLMGLIFVAGCADSIPIQKADSSKSKFDSAVYKGESGSP
jgi:hypothetical protein